MITSPFCRDQECEPSRSGDQTCRVFAWVGQTFSSCEECGKPYWEHMYNPVYGRGRVLFRVKHWEKWQKTWAWRRVGSIITATDAGNVRDQWEGR